MKYLIYISLLCISIACKAQNIVPLDSDADIFVRNSGDYYKDTNNEFNKYEGTWKWENGSTSLTFIFKKESLERFGYTYDLLSGEYQYIENSVELANTLDNINNPDITGIQHHITGCIIIDKNSYPACNDCSIDEKRISMSIENDDDRMILGELILRHKIVNGIEQMEVYVRDSSKLSTADNAPDHIDIPINTYYTLIKQ